jgi:very-short-patch-repair endonuclease
VRLRRSLARRRAYRGTTAVASISIRAAWSTRRTLSQAFKVLRFRNEIVLGNTELVLKPIAEALRRASADRLV